MVDVFVKWLELRCVDGSNLASCDVFGMLLKYGLSTESGFGGSETSILAGV